MMLEQAEPEREPWDVRELRLLFASSVYVADHRPKGGRGEAAFWLPLLGLFTGARLGELAPLTVADVETDEETAITVLKIIEDEERGRRLKTASSRRAVPLHQELVKFGFVQLVEQRRSSDGDRARPLSAPHPGTKGWLWGGVVEVVRSLHSQHWRREQGECVPLVSAWVQGRAPSCGRERGPERCPYGPQWWRCGTTLRRKGNGPTVRAAKAG